MTPRNFGRDLTTGSIPRHLLAVAVPMLIGNALNTGYSIIDTIWLGKIAGDYAVAATAVSFPVVMLFVALTAGATMAASILVSQYYGCRDYASVERTVGTSFTIAIILGAIIGVCGFLLGDVLLCALQTPAAVFPLASSYLKISFIGFMFQMLLFLVSAILRGIGDTRTPLYFMAAGVGMNALLDPLLIAGPGPFPRLGVSGAAIASVMSAFFAFICGMIYLNHHNSIVAFKPRRRAFDSATALLIGRIGLPSSIQHSFISIGMAAMTFLVNRFGPQAIAAYGAAGRVDAAAFMPAMTIGMAVSTLAGQNLGAGRIERVRESFRWGLLFTCMITGSFAIVFMSIPSVLMSAFVGDPEVIHTGTVYLRIIGPSLVFFAIFFVSNGVINGAGRTMVTMVFSLISLWGIRVPAAWLLSRTSLGVTGVWCGFAASFFVSMIISLAYYRTGKWRRPLVKKTAAAADTVPIVPVAEA